MSDNPVRISRRTVHAGTIVDLSIDRVRLPNGNEYDFEMIRHPGAAAIVPVLDDGRVLMIRQCRYATGSWLLEVPAGKLDDGEHPESCARREVEEETGHRPLTLVSLGWIWTTPGFSDEKIWLYLARDLKETSQELQPDELLTVVPMPLEQAVHLAVQGGITDAKSICALLRAERALAGQ